MNCRRCNYCASSLEKCLYNVERIEVLKAAFINTVGWERAADVSEDDASFIFKIHTVKVMESSSGSSVTFHQLI